VRSAPEATGGRVGTGCRPATFWWGLLGFLLVGIGPVIAETRYSPFPPAETAQRIAQVFQRHGLARLSPPGAVTVSSAQPERVRLVVESPARVVDASRCRWQDAYGRPITLEIHRDAQGVTWIDYRLPPKRVNAFGVIECGKTHDDLVQTMEALLSEALRR